MTKMGMKQLQILKSVLIVMFILAFLLKAFVPLTFLPTFMGAVAALVFCISFRDLTPLNRNMIILLLMVSSYFIWSGSGNFDWGRAMTENAGIITLLLTAPMLGAILHYAPYETVLLSLANRYIQTNYLFYIITLCLVAFMCALMNLAAIPFAYQLLSPVAASYPAATLYRALTRGFAFNLFWTPNLVCVAVVLQYVHISWQELVPAGMFFSVLSFIAASVVGKFDIQNGEMSPAELPKDAEKSWGLEEQVNSRRYVVMLLIQVVLILAALMALIQYANKSIYVTVAIIAWAMPLIFALFLGKLAIYRQNLTNYLAKILPNMSSEFMLFSSIGFLGYALAQSPAIAFVQSHLVALSSFSPSVLVVLIIATIACLAIAGIHPIITISSVAIALGNVDIGLSSLQFAISLITGYIMYLLLSPFSSMVMLLSALSRQNVYETGLGLNWRYAVVLVSLVAVTIHGWRLL